MTEKLLRDSLKEAQEKGQIGLLIWANWTQWDDYAADIRQGNENYEFALSQVKKEKEATITFEWHGLRLLGILAVSVSKMVSSEEFFKKVLELCEKNYQQGPITFIPSNELSESF